MEWETRIQTSSTSSKQKHTFFVGVFLLLLFLTDKVLIQLVMVGDVHDCLLGRRLLMTNDKHESRYVSKLLRDGGKLSL